MILLVWTLGVAVLTILFVRLVSGLWFPPSSWYWAGWSLGAAGVWYASAVGEIPPMTSFARELVTDLHTGAAIGIVLATVLYKVKILALNQPSVAKTRPSFRISRRFLNGVVLLTAGIGIGILLLRLQQVGISGDVSIAGLRREFLGDRNAPLQRLAAHLGVAVSFVPIALGWNDGQHRRIGWKRILWLWLATVPAGLASGGRGWVLGPFPAYFVAWLVAQDGPRAIGKLTTLSRRVLPLLLILGALFSFIAFMRQGTLILAKEVIEVSRYDRYLAPVRPVAFYFGVPLSALGPFAEYADTQNRSRGLLLFPWISGQLARVGVTERDVYAEFVPRSRWHVWQTTYSVIWSSHATVVTNIVGDFGREAVSVVGGVLMFTMQLIGLWGRRKGPIGHYLAVSACLFGGFWLFQDSMFGTAASILGIGWACLFAIFLGQSRIRRRKIAPAQAIAARSLMMRR